MVSGQGLVHVDDGEGFAVGEWDGGAVAFGVALERVERIAGEGASHFEAGEAGGAGSGFAVGEDE